MEAATRHQIVSFADLEKLIDQLTQVAQPRNPAAYRRAIEDFAIVCARFGADELRAKIAALRASDLRTPWHVH